MAKYNVVFSVFGRFNIEESNIYAAKKRANEIACSLYPYIDLNIPFIQIEHLEEVVLEENKGKVKDVQS